MSKLFKIASLLLYLLVCLLDTASGQGILNTEKYDLNKTQAFTLAGTFAFEGARGNSNLNKTDLEVITGYHSGNHIFKLVGGFNYLNSSGSVITSNIFSQLRYNHIFTSRLQSFTFYQLQKNDILLVKKRELVGAGLRISLVKDDSAYFNVSIGLGGMYENEQLKNAEDNQKADRAEGYFRLADYLSLQYRVKTVKIVDVLYFQPLINRFDDFRMYNDLSIQFKIQKHVAFETGFVYRYDSRPPGSLKREDLSLKNGIVFNF